MKKKNILIYSAVFAGFLCASIIARGVPSNTPAHAAELVQLGHIKLGGIMYDEEEARWTLCIHGEGGSAEMMQVTLNAASSEFPYANQKDVYIDIESPKDVYYCDEAADIDIDKDELTNVQIKWNGTDYNHVTYLELKARRGITTHLAIYQDCLHTEKNSDGKCLDCGRMLTQSNEYDPNWIIGRSYSNEMYNYCYRVVENKLYYEGVGPIVNNENPTVEGCTDVYFGRGITGIDAFFFDVETVKNVYFGKDVAFIGYGAFEDALALEKIVIDNPTPPVQSEYWELFDGDIPTEYVIEVPASSVDAYKAAPGWSQYADHIVAGHAHTPNINTKVEAVESTCSTHGHIEYYVCSGKLSDGSDCGAYCKADGSEVSAAELSLALDNTKHNYVDFVCEDCGAEDLEGAKAKYAQDMEDYIDGLNVEAEILTDILENSIENLDDCESISEMQVLFASFKNSANSAVLEVAKAEALFEIAFTAGLPKNRTQLIQAIVDEANGYIMAATTLTELNNKLANALTTLKMNILSDAKDEALSYIDDLAGELSDRSPVMNDVADQSFAFVEDAQSIEEIDAIKMYAEYLIGAVKAAEAEDAARFAACKAKAIELLAGAISANASESVKTIVNTAKTSINNATNQDVVISTLVTTLKAVKAQELLDYQASIAPDMAALKSTAKTKITALVPDMSKASQNITKLVNDAKTAIDACTTPEAINTVMTDSFKNILEAQNQEAIAKAVAVALGDETEIKSEAKSKLEAFVGNVNEVSNEMKTLLNAAKAEIDSAEDIDAVNEAYFKNFKLIRDQQVKEAKEKALAELPDEPEEPKQGVSTGAVVGIAVGSAAVAAGGMFAVGWFVIAKKTGPQLVAGIKGIFKKKQ